MAGRPWYRAATTDATIIRMFLVPAIMKLLGDDCWWAPRWMKRLQEKIGLGEITLDVEVPLHVGAGHPDLAGFQDLAHAFDLKSAALAARATLEAALDSGRWSRSPVTTISPVGSPACAAACWPSSAGTPPLRVMIWMTPPIASAP